LAGKFLLDKADKGYRDNIYIKKFWRSYKYKCLYLKGVSSLKEVKEISENGLNITTGKGCIKPEHLMRFTTEERI